MGFVSWTYTTSGTEGTPAFAIHSMSPFTGIFSVAIDSTSVADHDWYFVVHLTGPSSSTDCWSNTMYMSIGNSHVGNTFAVNPGTAGWSCLNWDTAYLTINFGGSFGRPAAGTTLTITFTGDAIASSGVCEYGFSQKQPLDSIVEVSAGLLDSLGILAGSPWAVPIILAGASAQIVLPWLCSGPPQAPQTIDLGDWTTVDATTQTSVAVRKVLQNFQNTAWNFFCQCSAAPAGHPPPTPPASVTWIQPSYYRTYYNIHVDETDISVQIRNLWQALYSTQITNNITNNQITNITNTTGDTNTVVNNNTTILNQLVSCSCQGAYTHGTTHYGLVGTGAVAVSGLLGFEVLITAKPVDTRVLPGNPGYNWNMGWTSVDNADGMLEEKRLTRDAYVWLPTQHELVTSFNYALAPGVEIAVTELLPAP